MSVLLPRQSFLTNDAAVKRYREFIDDPVIQSALQGVMIEFMRSNPTQEATRGANHFLQTLVGYSEKQPPVKQWPDHSKQLWAEPPPKPATKK